jgi:hypothetical protein
MLPPEGLNDLFYGDLFVKPFWSREGLGLHGGACMLCWASEALARHVGSVIKRMVALGEESISLLVLQKYATVFKNPSWLATEGICQGSSWCVYRRALH